MPADRIHDFIILEPAQISLLFSLFDPMLTVLDFSLIRDSMSNTGYRVTTTKGNYLLKVYSNTTDKIETAVYRYLQGKINVPELFTYDGSKQRFPFAYMILEFLDGETFVHRVRTSYQYPSEMAFEVGKMCATLHEKKYPYDALLDENLMLSEKIPGTRKKILYLLQGKPAESFRSETVVRLKEFIAENKRLFDRIEEESCLCHGDFGYANLMVSGEKLYLIDFEFAYSSSRYVDIGRFFRKKGDDIQKLIHQEVYDAFAQGYHSISSIPLPSNWLKLANLCDISAQLCLLNYDHIPKEWREEVENSILDAIKP